MLQRQFWSKAHLQKYNMLTLYKYSSLSFQTCITYLKHRYLIIMFFIYRDNDSLSRFHHAYKETNTITI